MIKFLVKISLYIMLLLIALLVIFLIEGGYSDPFYLRFTTPKQKSLIIGTSRPAQGLIPSVINKELKGLYDHPIFNYSFSLAHSPYGKIYYNSIVNKLDENVKDGIFIIAVDPWSISDNSEERNKENSFREKNHFLAKMDDVSTNPNFTYLLNHYPIPYYNIVLRRFIPKQRRLHKDGWLEVSVPMDSTKVHRRSKEKILEYGKNAKEYRFSQARYEYLQKTIQMLQAHGDVYLVRLPITSEMQRIENDMMADFNNKMKPLEEKYNIPYLDMTMNPGAYRFTDGNHLHKSSSKVVSLELSHWIKEYRRIKGN